MTKEQQIDTYKELIDKAQKTLLNKGDDYANTDRLSNFKDASKIAGISTQQQCLSLIAVKVARLGNLYKGNKPHYESIQDSIIDLFNYTALLYMIETDNTK